MDLSLLEKKSAARIMLHIADNPGCPKSAVVNKPTGPDKTALSTLNALIDGGMVICDDSPRAKNAILLELTSLGYRVVAELRKLERI